MSKTNSDAGDGKPVPASEESDGFIRFCAGHPLEYAMQGVKEIPSSDRRSHPNLQAPIRERFGTDVSEETANVIERLYSSVDAKKLVQAVKTLGLDEVEDYSGLFSEETLDDMEVEEADLGAVMQALDVKITESLAPRDIDASKVSKKKHRETVYIPDVINAAGEDGTVYMAKTLSTSAKVRMAHDLHDNNQVIVVDDYDKWERLLGWQKLKSFPHGKNKIREELGDRLSADVLDIVAGDKGTSTDSDTKDDTSSSGRRTRTKPTDEVLNVARSSRHRKRFKQKAEDIKDEFEDEGYIGSSYNPVQMLVLFPTTTDLNMTDHWWVAGDRWPDGGHAAIANCNKGTFEYLNQLEQVWHIEDYLAQAGDYEFQTNHGPVTMDTVEHDSLVFHILEDEARERVMQEPVFSHMPETLPEYCGDELYSSPDFPHADDMLYAPISQEDVFWMRPELRKQQNPDEGDAIILYADSSPRDLGQKYSVSSDYKLYARARLYNWDFDSTEMEQLDRANHYLRMDRGGFEVIETLAMLHDNGEQPFSKNPRSRWSQ
jgi:hypothetical protein